MSQEPFQQGVFPFEIGLRRDRNQKPDQLKEILKANIIKTTEVRLEKTEKPEYMLIKLTGSVSSVTCISLKLQLEEIISKSKN